MFPLFRFFLVVLDCCVIKSVTISQFNLNLFSAFLSLLNLIISFSFVLSYITNSHFALYTNNHYFISPFRLFCWFPIWAVIHLSIFSVIVSLLCKHYYYYLCFFVHHYSFNLKSITFNRSDILIYINIYFFSHYV